MDNRIDIIAIECQFSPDQGLLAQKYPPDRAGIRNLSKTLAEHPLHYSNRAGESEEEDVAQASVAYEALLPTHRNLPSSPNTSSDTYLHRNLSSSLPSSANRG